MKIEVGDWVRFYQNGKMIIGRGEYLRYSAILGGTEACTDQGAVDVESVLEVRRPLPASPAPLEKD